jgi:hypothetical protein
MMFFSSWFRTDKSGHRRNRCNSASTWRRAFRPSFEPLERRALLATLQVTTDLDVVDPNDTFLSLREAVLQANASPGPDTIKLPPGQYSLSLTGADEDFAATGDLDVRDDLTIVGAGRNETVIGGCRAFDVFGVNLTLSGATVGGGSDDHGGAISVQSGSLALDNVRVSGHLSVPDGNLYGGGIYAVDSSVSIVNAWMVGNTVEAMRGDVSGGAIYTTGGSLKVVNSLFVGNMAFTNGLRSVASGGAIFSHDTDVRVSNSTFELNQAYSENGSAFGGAIFVSGGTTMFTNTAVRYNGANGGVREGDVAYGGGLYVTAGNTVLQNVTLFWNAAYSTNGRGGGIYSVGGSLSLSQCDVVANTAEGLSSAEGGGLYVSDGVVVIRKSRITENRAYIYGSATTSSGGGLFIEGGVTDLDAATFAALIGNFADIDPNIHGPYVLG